LLAIAAATLAAGAVVVNALFLQSGPHPAPIFPPSQVDTPPMPRPRPTGVKAESTGAVEQDTRRTLARYGFAEATSADPVRQAGVIPADGARDSIAWLLAPSRRVAALQRALADYGYGQIRLSGSYDAQTRSAIEQFERDRNLPVTGRISDRLVRELEALTGRALQ